MKGEGGNEGEGRKGMPEIDGGGRKLDDEGKYRGSHYT